MADFKILWMRSILRLEASTDPFTWPDEEVVFAFAARPKQDAVPYEAWCLRMGLESPKLTPEEENEAALNALRATAPKHVTIASEKSE